MPKDCCHKNRIIVYNNNIVINDNNKGAPINKKHVFFFCSTC